MTTNHALVGEAGLTLVLPVSQPHGLGLFRQIAQVCRLNPERFVDRTHQLNRGPRQSERKT